MKRKFRPSRLILILLLICSVMWGGWLLLLARTGPAVEQMPEMVRERLEESGGSYVTLLEMPVILPEAVVATEDQSFWSNPGIDGYYPFYC